MVVVVVLVGGGFNGFWVCFFVGEGAFWRAFFLYRHVRIHACIYPVSGFRFLVSGFWSFVFFLPGVIVME